MHRLAAQPGSHDPDQRGQLVEQAPAPVLVLTSADTDLRLLATLTQAQPGLLGLELRGLNLSALGGPAQVDHYLSTTVAHARLVVVRLLGGRGHWSYGLEQLQLWASQARDRQLLVLAGTPDEDSSLSAMGTVEPLLAQALARCWRAGGEANLVRVLESLAALLRGAAVPWPEALPQADPLPHDWRDEAGPRVGVVLYRALLQADDTAWMDALLAALRRQGLVPRGLWVSGLRDAVVADGVGRLLARERVEAVLCGTAFASVQFDEAGLGAPLWDGLGVPVLQVLGSSQSRAIWEASSIGLSPLDLTLQVALPELDGRLTTRVGAFKESVEIHDPAGTGHATSTATGNGHSPGIGSALHHYQPDPSRLDWVVQLCRNWISLARTPAPQRRIALVLANYPTRNSRLANGVGLDTPASTALMLQWLQDAGYALPAPPADGDALIAALLAGRSNDPESDHLVPMDRLPLDTYCQWYATLPGPARSRLEQQWGLPETDPSLERGPSGLACFSIKGLLLGHVAVLIQPARGYDRDPATTFHSPDLAPTHAYLAQYLWLRQVFGAQAVVHVGKHGNLEWLPGKALGLSDQCFPELALGPMPHLYPFIVNDPGEGSQAKRRAQAVILDHLTPPLGRAGLYGSLLELESLLDEYWEACALGSERSMPLRQKLADQLGTLNLVRSPEDLDAALDAADGYLCELKEAQIRLGLHTYGTLPDEQRSCELLLCLARAPQAGLHGLTQALALDHGFGFDPWADPEEQPLAPADRERLLQLQDQQGTRENRPSTLRRVGDGVAWLEAQALELIRQAWGAAEQLKQQPQQQPQQRSQRSPLTAPGPASEACLQHLWHALIPRLRACGDAERRALMVGLDGGRIQAGPAGAPTRGRPDLLPTGRNFYSVDLRGLPTETAWDLGRRSAELLLELHLQEQGEPLRTLALSVWGTATMRNGGEDIAQALALLGVRPVWDGPTRRLVDLELIPLSLLQRPRVDVTLRISGLFRDAFPQLVALVNRACALVAAQDEAAADNPLAEAARRDGHAGRVYGSAPGAYGAGLQALIDSGQWEGRDQLGEAFLQWSSWRYDSSSAGPAAAAGSIEACPDRTGLERRLQAVQVVLHNQDNREHDLLDSDDYYQFQGGLSAAAEQLQGQAPAVWFADHSRQQRPRLHRLERELDKVLRSRLLNPRWIEAMGEHGYKGGFEMAASLDYLFAYDASTGRAPDWGYGAIQQAWLEDPAVRRRLEQSNPWALRDMGERLLEAHNRGLWQGANPDQLERLRQLVRESEALTEAAPGGRGS
jgi:cobaltochelatase CobN